MVSSKHYDAIIGKFGGADQLRNADNQLQSLLYSTAQLVEQTRIIAAEGERRLSVVEELAVVVSANSDKSRDSVVHRASSGNLKINNQSEQRHD